MFSICKCKSASFGKPWTVSAKHTSLEKQTNKHTFAHAKRCTNEHIQLKISVIYIQTVTARAQSCFIGAAMFDMATLRRHPNRNFARAFPSWYGKMPRIYE